MVEFQLLGPLRVSEGGHNIDAGGAKQQRVLAALLMARGSVVSTDRLVDLVWGDSAPSKPNLTLRSYISHLRRVLEPGRGAGDRARMLVTQAPGYALQIEAVQVDVVRFELACDQARDDLDRGRLADALQNVGQGLVLWRSDQVGDGTLDSDDPDVIRLASLRASALELELELELLLQLGRNSEAIPSLEAWLAADPLREGLRGLLMLALYRSGRKADALSSYKVARDVSVGQLGLDPGHALRELEHHILTDDPSLAWEAPPRPTTIGSARAPDQRVIEPPIGRERIAELLRSALEQGIGGTARLAALIGEPGIGKTTLLSHVSVVARQLGYTVALGRCYETGYGATLRPWATVLEELTEHLSTEELDRAVAGRASVVGHIVPSIASRLGAEVDHSPDQHTVFDAVTQLLRRLADRSPLLLAFEDLHWADLISVQLLNFVFAEMSTSRMLVATTWRDTEQPPAEIVSGLADLARTADDLRMAIPGLAVHDAEMLYGQQFGEDLDPALARAVVQQTAGNPLFLKELLRTLADTGEVRTTDTIRDVLTRRIDRLPPGSEAALTIGALCPNGFNEQLIATVTAVPFRPCRYRRHPGRGGCPAHAGRDCTCLLVMPSKRTMLQPQHLPITFCEALALAAAIEPPSTLIERRVRAFDFGTTRRPTNCWKRALSRSTWLQSTTTR
ncbi:MAG: DNA-binding SARP family transcriptional activator [Acidimicrobiales bacterium]